MCNSLSEKDKKKVKKCKNNPRERFFTFFKK